MRVYREKFEKVEMSPGKQFRTKYCVFLLEMNHLLVFRVHTSQSVLA